MKIAYLGRITFAFNSAEIKMEMWSEIADLTLSLVPYIAWVIKTEKKSHCHIYI